MSRLVKELDELVARTAEGNGFGDQNALEQHQREIDLLKFKIARQDKMKIAVISALIGAVVGALVSVLANTIN